ncbi:MAG: SUMF1/EgtB/PvdO family nonheme iron enzyme [Phycisphaerae bacterium]|jgi:hypothetical protein|nr:SUMF1/EgtB/PvdO family nonheme iron enzyme [Phycisphaerae bacterium]
MLSASFTRYFCLLSVCCAAFGVAVPEAQSSDSFGAGENQFTIDFVTISGDASAANGITVIDEIPFGEIHMTFNDPVNDYRMGVYEITNDQWSKFTNAYGQVVGAPPIAYQQEPSWPGPNVPVDNLSWCEAAQMVNWLNTSTDHHAAYKFTGTQGTSDYTLDKWDASEADNGTNLYRHKDAFYFIPTEDEWIKAGHWNGVEIQHFAARDISTLDRWTPDGGPNSDGQAAGWNYNSAYPYPDYIDEDAEPWDVTAGYSPLELNGTYDMMGNVNEWTESPFDDATYGIGSDRAEHGGSFRMFSIGGPSPLACYARWALDPYSGTSGFRVASRVPEPCSLGLLALGGLAVLHKNRKRRRRR